MRALTFVKWVLSLLLGSLALGLHGAEPSKIPADEPSTDGVKIDEAHRTSPPNTAQKDGAASGSAAEGGTGEPRRGERSTEGEKIPEAHDTPPEDKPENEAKKHDKSR